MASPRDVSIVRAPGALSSTTVLKVLLGGTTSAPADIRRYTLFAIYVPSTFNGSGLTIEVSHDGVVWGQFYDITGAPVIIGGGVIVADRRYDIPGELSPYPYMRVVCASTQTGTDTDFTLIMKY